MQNANPFGRLCPVPDSLFAVLIWCTFLFANYLLCCAAVTNSFKLHIKTEIRMKTAFCFILYPPHIFCPKHSKVQLQSFNSRVNCVLFLDTPGQGGNKQTMHFSCANIRSFYRMSKSKFYIQLPAMRRQVNGTL